jgi:hypothetical protein
MLAKLLRTPSIIVVLLLAAILLAGCDSTDATPLPEPGTYTVDTVFREFYASLGGRDTLGPAISALFNYRNKECQYVQNAMMCFDPLAEGIARFMLFPLGDSLGIYEAPEISAAGNLVVDGYPIYEEFEEIYHRLYGPLYVGRPLTQPRYNGNGSRIEQYFQNVGLYRSVNDPPGEVHLLSYGVFACSADCQFVPPQSAIVTANISSASQPYLSQVARLGGLNVFGMPLTNPYVAPDGNLEQIYENVVLYSPQEDTSSLQLRPVALLLGVPVHPPGPELRSQAEGVVFYPTDGDLGYHVPLVFDYFIAQHGGREISGKPLGEISPFNGTLYRQCFVNYCLYFDSSAAESLQVRMAPLGLDYLNQTQAAPVVESTPFALEAQTIHMVANPGTPRIPADQSQRFDLFVVRLADNQPIPNIESELTLTMQNGIQTTYQLPPTDTQGRASLTVPPIEPAPLNGTVISFKVCLNVPADGPVCKSDSYLIWNFQ